MKKELYKNLDIDWPIIDRTLKERQNWENRPNERLFKEVLDSLPICTTQSFDAAADEVRWGQTDELSPQQEENLLNTAKKLMPWKKGPFKLFGHLIDGEWRSDRKWKALAPHLPGLKDKKILDIGCNNGYFMFRMLDQNPEFVLGIDPVIRTMAQFRFLDSISPKKNLDYALLGVEHVEHFKECFDIIFSMGIIYHHPDPMAQLKTLKAALKPGGLLVLETIGIPGTKSIALFPEERYAKMRNVYFVPTPTCLVNWTKKAKFKDVKLAYEYKLTSEEQRTTSWSNPEGQSLEDFLNPNNPEETIEGHPAPLRFCVLATKGKNG
jgi:tRNA (mo5U34)-methyltransferase